jgi:hypothetical protein
VGWSVKPLGNCAQSYISAVYQRTPRTGMSA